jgi:hypothetical protein
MIWYTFSYPLMLASCFVMGRWEGTPRWLVATAMMFATYTADLMFIPGSGELLPFAILLMTVLVVPLGLAGKLGAWYWRA